MIVYCISKQRRSMLQDIQKRLWREHHPQSDFMTIVSRSGRPIDMKEHVNRAIGLIKPSGHRFGVILHEDCIPLRKLDPEDVLKGHSLAGRVAPDGVNPHPSRTWIAADCQTEGKTWLGYHDREVTLDDLPAPADRELREAFELCMPGFLHLDNWYRHPEGDALWEKKRDWILSAYFDYAQLPPIATRVMSFAKAIVSAAAGGPVPVVPRDVWTERLEICKECDAFDAGRCRYCGCGMRTKSRLKSQDCPIGRWPLFEETESVDD